MKRNVKTESISVFNMGLSFKGYAEDAYTLIKEFEDMRRFAHGDWSNVMSDFIYYIETELQKVGYLDENFKPTV